MKKIEEIEKKQIKKNGEHIFNKQFLLKTTKGGHPISKHVEDSKSIIHK